MIGLGNFYNRHSAQFRFRDWIPSCSSVLLIPNFLVLCANFSSKSNSSPRLRTSAVQLDISRFFSVSQCLRGAFWPWLWLCYSVASVVGLGCACLRRLDVPES